ncbi:hypothetical protein DPX16_12384 [Anabarilius grahami]|uniref:Uncharacterized protein n=1 Tax=Anabarilius grahami TaxID=495550 RepID=A0A3N0XFW5_ANAGA|nr:hypothetical protein DPX16_12384 [Anabarilius grahami]
MHSVISRSGSSSPDLRLSFSVGKKSNGRNNRTATQTNLLLEGVCVCDVSKNGETVVSSNRGVKTVFTGFFRNVYESHDFLQNFVSVFYLISKRSVMSLSGQAQTWIWSGETKGKYDQSETRVTAVALRWLYVNTPGSALKQPRGAERPNQPQMFILPPQLLP